MRSPHPSVQRFARLLLLGAVLALPLPGLELGCSFILSTGSPPVVQPLALATAAGSTVAGQVMASSPIGAPLTFSLHIPPAHGQLTVFDRITGAFV